MWAVYNREDLVPKINARRYDDGRGNRFYYFGDSVAAGITTVFGAVSVERDSIDIWKKNNPNWQELLDKAAEYGTLMHEVYADIMTGHGVIHTKIEEMTKVIRSIGGSSNAPKKDVLAFMKWMKDVKLKPLIIEGVLVWRCPRSGEHLAMTIDLLAEVEIMTKEKTEVRDGYYKSGKNKGKPKWVKKVVEKVSKKIIQVDFKSNTFEKERKNFYETHKMQLIGAARAVEQNFGIKVDELYNWSPNAWRTEPTYTFYKWDITQQDVDLWETYWRLAILKGINKPSGKIFVSNLENPEDFAYYNYPEFVTNFLNQ